MAPPALELFDLPLLRSSRADRFYRGYYLKVLRELRRRSAEAARRVSRGLIPVAADAERSWTERAVKILTELTNEIVEEGSQFAAAELTVGGGPFRAKQEVMGGFGLPLDTTRISEWVEANSEGMSRHSREKLTAIFQNASTETDEFGSGLTPRDIASRIINDSVITDKAKARVTARTGVIWAYGEGTVQTYQQAGVGAMQWLTTKDDLLCDFCRAMDGVTIRPGAAFWEQGARMEVQAGGKILGLDFGLDVRHPPLHPSCRCTLVPVVAEESILTTGGKPVAPDGTGDVIQEGKDIRQAIKSSGRAAIELSRANVLFKKTTKKAEAELKAAPTTIKGATEVISEQKKTFAADFESTKSNISNIRLMPPPGSRAATTKHRKRAQSKQAQAGTIDLRTSVTELQILVTKNRTTFSRSTNKSLTAVDKRLADVELRLRQIEKTLATDVRPTKRALKRIQVATAEVKEALAELKAAKKALRAARKR